MYDSPPSTFDEMLVPLPTKIRDTTRWLRAVILESFPQVSEGIYGGAKVAMALYSVGTPDAVALGIQPGERFVKVFIHDPDRLGKPSFKLEGRGKHMRHIKFSEPPHEKRAELIDLMRIPVERRS